MGSIGNTQQTTLISNNDIDTFRSMTGQNRSDLINQVSQKLGGRVGSISSVNTKNDIIIGDYAISLTTGKDRATGLQKIKSLLVRNKKDNKINMYTI